MTRHRLLAGLQVDDRQPLVIEADGVVHHVALVVGPAMVQRRRHVREQREIHRRAIQLHLRHDAALSTLPLDRDDRAGRDGGRDGEILTSEQ